MTANMQVELNAREHAQTILVALDGDWREALTFMDVYAIWYGIEYAMELEKFLTPRGEA